MSSRPELKLDWCSYQAAKYAVEKWHYSRRMPAGKLTRVGVWEGTNFIGCVLFGRGANNHLASEFGLRQTQACELVRIALCRHVTPVSRIVTIAIRMLRELSPGIDLILSYADPAQLHHGGIYQALGWIYLGSSRPQRELVVGGNWMHKRSASSRWGTQAILSLSRKTGLPVSYGPLEWKHKYALPLNAEVRARLQPLAKPYPKRAGSIGNDAPAIPGGNEGGATPTPALQTLVAVLDG